jgi:acyl carrier protein
MIDRTSVTGRVFEIVGGIMSEHALQAPHDIDDDLSAAGLNSMAMVKLMLSVEAAFNVAIPDADLSPENFRSIRSVETLVGRLLGGNSGSAHALESGRPTLS